MNRRSFLSLLAATPLIPALVKLAPLIAPELPVLAPAPAVLLPRMIQHYAIGLRSEWVAAGRIARLACMPQRTFKPKRLMIAAPSFDFEILHVSAAGEPQFDCGLPARFFSPELYGSHLVFEPVGPGCEIVLAVLNTGSRAAQFNAMFTGEALT